MQSPLFFGLALALLAAPVGRVVSNYDDCMEGRTPVKPKFTAIAPKRGALRGYVKDAQGRPVVGAKIMASSSAFGGFRTSATGTTNAQGYYEVAVPKGIARVWCAGVVVSQDGLRMALPLHPADNTLEDFDTTKGAVENFVLRSWGVANENGDPSYSRNYYGGAFWLSYPTREPDDQNAPKDWLVLGSTIELTLTPDGPLMDGSKGEPLTFKAKVGSVGHFEANDIPIGRYSVKATLAMPDGKPQALRLRDNSRTNRPGGLEPKESNGQATLRFRSESTDPVMLRVPGGGMERLSLLIDAEKTNS
ncbi:MAG: carboxypeptidase-like regulatory domain-containing protein [Armatimonas sp.]